MAPRKERTPAAERARAVRTLGAADACAEVRAYNINTHGDAGDPGAEKAAGTAELRNFFDGWKKPQGQRGACFSSVPRCCASDASGALRFDRGRSSSPLQSRDLKRLASLHLCRQVALTPGMKAEIRRYQHHSDEELWALSRRSAPLIFAHLRDIPPG